MERVEALRAEALAVADRLDARGWSCRTWWWRG